MKPQVWISSMVLVVAFGCQEVGECWPISEDGQGAGVGGGPIVPGSGGYGDVPPKPQSTTSPPPADCLIVPAGECHQKCLDNYENSAVKCAKIQDEAQRKACDDAAHATYNLCRNACQVFLNECYDKCDEVAAEKRKLCDGMSPGPGQAKCYQAVEEQRADCYRDCNKK